MLDVSPEVERYLAHFGIKGMKWGVRRKRGSDGTVGGKKSTKPEKPDPKSMTDEQLRSAINRMQMERQFRDLSTQTAKKSAGKEIALNIAKNVLVAQVTSTLNKEIGRSIDVALESTRKYKMPEASSLSRKDLEKAVKQMDLEARYNKRRK